MGTCGSTTKRPATSAMNAQTSRDHNLSGYTYEGTYLLAARPQDRGINQLHEVTDDAHFLLQAVPEDSSWAASVALCVDDVSREERRGEK